MDKWDPSTEHTGHIVLHVGQAVQLCHQNNAIMYVKIYIYIIYIYILYVYTHVF